MKTQAPKAFVFVALGGNAAIAIIKFIAAAYSGSAAMLSEAVHSVADTGNQALLLYGSGRAAQPPDRRHPFGHGREIYFWGFIVAILLFSMGSGMSIYEGILKILEPHPPGNPLVNYLVLGAAFCFEGGSAFFAFREFNRRRGETPMLLALQASKDPSLMTVLIEDSTALIGLAIAAAGITVAYFGEMPIADGIASLAIGAALALAAAFLAYEIKSLLIGEAAGRKVVAGIQSIVDRCTKKSGLVRRVNDIRTMQLGPSEVLIVVSLDFHAEAKADDIEIVTSELEDTLRRAYPQAGWVFIDVRCAERYEKGRLQHGAQEPVDR